MKKLGKIFQQRKNKKTEVESAQQDKKLVGGEDNGITLNAVDTAQTNDDYSCLRQVEDYQDDQSISESDKKTGGVADFSIVDDSTATLDDEQQTDRNTQAANSRSKENNKENPSSQPSNNSNGDITNSVVIGGNLFGFTINVVSDGISKKWAKKKFDELIKQNGVELVALEERLRDWLLVRITESDDNIKIVKDLLETHIAKENNFEDAIKQVVENLSRKWEEFYNEIKEDVSVTKEQLSNAQTRISRLSDKIVALEKRMSDVEEYKANFEEYVNKYVEEYVNKYGVDLEERMSKRVDEKNDALREEFISWREWMMSLILPLIKNSKDKDKPNYDDNGCCPRCGSYHSFDIYKRGEEGEEPYYICAVCGMKDNEKKEEREINGDVHILKAKEGENIVYLCPINQHNAFPEDYKKVLVKSDVRGIYAHDCNNVGDPLNSVYNTAELLSLSIPNIQVEDKKYYTLGEGLFDFRQGRKFKLYGMKYVAEIEKGCFIGIQGDEERRKFWKENGFEIDYNSECFAD